MVKALGILIKTLMIISSIIIKCSQNYCIMTTVKPKYCFMSGRTWCKQRNKQKGGMAVTKTITFVTNQYSCDRIIHSARIIADETNTDLIVVGILDNEYELDSEVIDYLFILSKKNKATMRLLFSDDKTVVMTEAISQLDCANVVTGMPNSNESVLYKLWNMFPAKDFYTVDTSGEIIEVASKCKNVNA